MATKRVNIDIVAKDKTRQALSGVQRNLTSLKNNVFSLKGALVGIGAGAVVKSFVDVGREVESLKTRFKFFCQSGNLFNLDPIKSLFLLLSLQNLIHHHR